MGYADEETEKKLKALERKLASTYQEAYKEMSAEAKKYFAGFEARYNAEYEAFQNGAYTQTEFNNWVTTQIARGKQWNAVKNDMARRMSNANQTASAYINDETPGVYSLNHNYTAYQISNDNDGIAFDMVDEQTVKQLMNESNNFTEFRTTSVNRKTDYEWNSKEIQKALNAGIVQGKSISKMTDSFMTVMKRNRTSAIRNARTSVTSAQNAGKVASMKQAQKMGIELQKKWSAVGDSRTRFSHAMLDGQIRDIDKNFSNGLEHPGDSSGSPSEVYNCRCGLTYVYPKYESQTSNERWEEMSDSQKSAEKKKYKKWQSEMSTVHKSQQTSYNWSKTSVSEKEKELEYGYTYGSKSVSTDSSYFETEEFKNKFSSITESETVNTAIYETAKKAVTENLGTNYESMYLLDMDTGNVITEISDSQYKIKNGVTYPDYFKEKLAEANESGTRILAIHNHPEGYPPSANDFMKAKENGYEMGIAVGANTQVYTYTNMSVDLTEEECNRIHTQIESVGVSVDPDRIYKEIYNQIHLEYNTLK